MAKKIFPTKNVTTILKEEIPFAARSSNDKDCAATHISIFAEQQTHIHQNMEQHQERANIYIASKQHIKHPPNCHSNMFNIAVIPFSPLPRPVRTPDSTQRNRDSVSPSKKLKSMLAESPPPTPPSPSIHLATGGQPKHSNDGPPSPAGPRDGSADRST